MDLWRPSGADLRSFDGLLALRSTSHSFPSLFNTVPVNRRALLLSHPPSLPSPSLRLCRLLWQAVRAIRQRHLAHVRQ